MFAILLKYGRWGNGEGIHRLVSATSTAHRTPTHALYRPMDTSASAALWSSENLKSAMESRKEALEMFAYRRKEEEEVLL